ncbi:hypothetical protein AO261_15680 [Pseudomonas avellanae]|nr:hypothetical protein AO261_15680 [Pseudomonas avellanae]
MLVVWGCVRYLAIGGGVSLFFQRSLIDSLTIDFDPGKVQETAFKADTCLALLIAGDSMTIRTPSPPTSGH